MMRIDGNVVINYLVHHLYLFVEDEKEDKVVAPTK